MRNMRNAMLPSNDDVTASAQRSSAQLEQFLSWVCGKHKVLVGAHKHEDDDESTADNH